MRGKMPRLPDLACRLELVGSAHPTCCYPYLESECGARCPAYRIRRVGWNWWAVPTLHAVTYIWSRNAGQDAPPTGCADWNWRGLRLELVGSAHPTKLWEETLCNISV